MGSYFATRGRGLAAPALFGAALLALLAGSPAHAADKLVVAKSTPVGMAWIPVNIGVNAGIFQKEGLDIEIVGMGGAAKLHQAMTAGGADIALGSGTDLGYLVKGAPEIGIADMADHLRDLGINVWNGHGINSLDDLKGKKIGVSSPGSLTEYLALELANVKGWGPKGVSTVYLGGDWAAFTAALETSQVDAVVNDPGLGFQLDQQGKGHLLASAADYIPPLVAHAIYASKAVIQKNPDAVRRFLKGWFETIAYMKTHPDESVKAIMQDSGLDATLSKKQYDLDLPMFSTTGKWDPTGVAGVAQALVDIKFLDAKTDLTPYYTDKYLPAE